MANELDEVTGPTSAGGRDINVIEKQLQVEVGSGTKLLDVAVWLIGLPLGFLLGLVGSGGSIGAGLLATPLGLTT